MMKKYRFKVKVNNNKEGNCYLNIKPFFIRNNNGVNGGYPIDFSELNVPLSMNKSKSYFGGEDIDYFLDFENSFDGNGNSYGKTYFKRDGQRRILRELERHLDPLIVKFLNGNINLLKRMECVVFESNGGLELPKKTLKYGEPKSSRRPRGPRIEKRILD